MNVCLWQKIQTESSSKDSMIETRWLWRTSRCLSDFISSLASNPRSQENMCWSLTNQNPMKSSIFPVLPTWSKIILSFANRRLLCPSEKNGWGMRNILTSFKNSYFGRHLFCRLQHSIQWCYAYISLVGLLFPPFPPSCFSFFFQRLQRSITTN